MADEWSLWDASSVRELAVERLDLYYSPRWLPLFPYNIGIDEAKALVERASERVPNVVGVHDATTCDEHRRLYEEVVRETGAPPQATEEIHYPGVHVGLDVPVVVVRFRGSESALVAPRATWKGVGNCSVLEVLKALSPTEQVRLFGRLI